MKSKGKAPEGWLTQPQVARITNACGRTVKGWVSPSHDSPFEGRMKIGKAMYWDPVALLEWLATHGRGEAVARLGGYVGSMKGPLAPSANSATEKVVQSFERKARKDAKSAAAAGDASGPVEVAASAALSPAVPGHAEAVGDGVGIGGGGSAASGGPAGRSMDIFTALEVTAKLYVKATQRLLASANSPNYFAEARNVRETGEAMRRLQMDCLQVDRELGKVIPFAMAERFVGQMLARVRTDFQGFAFSLADALAGMEDAAEIRDFLKREIENGLRHLTRSFGEYAKEHALNVE